MLEEVLVLELRFCVLWCELPAIGGSFLLCYLGYLSSTSRQTSANAANGRLYVQPSGVVTVQVETVFSNAQCFTSLDGVSFIANP